MSQLKIYVASSWRNEYQPLVVKELREQGFEVYDFKDSEGFHWYEVDPNWKDWTPKTYLEGLTHSCAERGFNRDMKALSEADICVMVFPCGTSASLEAGWACGNGTPLFIYVPEIREPDLMIKMADLITTDFLEIIKECKRTIPKEQTSHFYR